MHVVAGGDEGGDDFGDGGWVGEVGGVDGGGAAEGLDLGLCGFVAVVALRGLEVSMMGLPFCDGGEGRGGE